MNEKSCTTWDVRNPESNGIFTISTGAGFQPSTVHFPHLDDVCRACQALHGYAGGHLGTEVVIDGRNLVAQAPADKCNAYGWMVGFRMDGIQPSGEGWSRKEAPVFLGSFSEMLSLKDLTTLSLQKLLGEIERFNKNHLGVYWVEFSPWGWYHKSQVNMVVIIANGDVFLVFETLKIRLSLNVPF